ncbi:MAG: diguanylate cyclase [Planctomycetaceae bacterium]
MTNPTLAQLPSMPGAVIKLLQMFADPEVGISDVVDTLKTDPALAARILKAANSSSVAASREVSDIRRAATLLGKKTVCTLALSFSLSDSSLESGRYGALYRGFWNQSMVTGVAAFLLAKKYRSLPGDEAFLIGLLSRIGRLGAISFAPEEFSEATQNSIRDSLSLDAMFLSTLSSSCEELTLQYTQAWRLPTTFIAHIESMQKAAARDRRRESSAETADLCDAKDLNAAKGLSASTLLRVASAIGQFFAGENTGIALATIHELMNPVLNGCGEALDELFNEVRDEFARYAEMLNFDTSQIGTPAELHSRAMAHLTEIALAPDSDSGTADDQEVCEVVWLQRQVRDLTRQLSLDGLTCLYNRAYFDQQVETMLASARLTRHFVAVLFVDVNEFKLVNDTYGHDVGDEVLKAVARTLQESVRRDDVVARYGGDEFVILCQMNDFNGLEAQAERITQQTNDLSVPCRGVSLRISLAIGGAIGEPDGSPDFAARLLRASDEAMYRAKESRCNPVTQKLSHDPALHRPCENQPCEMIGAH